jgi:hypothetical protein
MTELWSELSSRRQDYRGSFWSATEERSGSESCRRTPLNPARDFEEWEEGKSDSFALALQDLAECASFWSAAEERSGSAALTVILNLSSNSRVTTELNLTVELCSTLRETSKSGKRGKVAALLSHSKTWRRE